MSMTGRANCLRCQVWRGAFKTVCARSSVAIDLLEMLAGLEQRGFVAGAGWQKVHRWQSHIDSLNIISFPHGDGAGGTWLLGQVNELGDMFVVAEGCEDAHLCGLHTENKCRGAGGPILIFPRFFYYGARGVA